MTFFRLPRALIGLLVLSLAACGGGGGGPTAGVGIGGTGKPGVTVGAVQDTTGGLTVAGTTFDTSMALVEIGGVPASAGDLRQGHVAVVDALLDGATGTAETIHVDEVVKGRLAGIPDAGTLIVQGQTVEVDERTVFGPGIAPASVAGLLVDDLLEIWGYVRGPGLVRATRIEREDSLSERRVVGIVESLDTMARTFRIGGLDIDYTTADVSGLAGGHPGAGATVDVRGTPGPGGVLVATRIDPQELEDRDDDTEAEVEGYITAILSATRFSVGGGVTVETNAQTAYVGGTALDLLVGTEVDVDGTLVAGVLVATRIEFEAGIEIEADIEMKSGSMLTLVGLPGVVVLVDDLTEYDGDASSLADLQPGDHVQIEGRRSGAGTVVAVEIDEDSADTRIRIQAPVDASPAPADPIFHVLGVVIDTTSIPASGFESEDGAPITRATFFAMLTAGRLVQISGDLVGGTPVWDEAELDDE